MLAIALLTLASLEPSATPPSRAELQIQIKRAPREIAKFIERRAACNHWDGEAGSSNPEREQQIQTERTKLRCNAIDTNATSLRQKYRDDAAVLKLLSATEDLQPE